MKIKFRLIIASVLSIVCFGASAQQIDSVRQIHSFSAKEAVDYALQNATQETLAKDFVLKANGKVLFSQPIIESISSTLNHWVHHRGQLTVYMRMNDIAVPSIYGPSADDKSFTAPK